MDNSLGDNRLKRLLISNTLFTSGTLISQIFLNIFLFKNTSDISIVALFNIILFSFQSLGFIIFGGIVKSYFRNLFHFVSLFGLSFIYFIIVLLGNSVVEYYISIAIIIGFFRGIYWVIYNNNEFDLSHIHNRGNYHGLKKSLKTFSAIIVPSTIGSIIGINYLGYGYEISFIIGTLLYILSAFIGFIKHDYGTNTKYCFKNAIRILVKDKNFTKLTLNYSLLGFSLSNPLLNTIIPLLLFSYGMRELNLGFVLSFFSILTVIVTYIFGKYLSYNKYKKIYIFAGMYYIFSILILLFSPQYWYIVVFVSMIYLIFNFIDIPQNVFSANVFNQIKGHSEIRSEYIVLRELFLNFGRIFSFVCIYFIGSFDVFGIQILFGIMGVIMLFSVYLFSIIDYE